jgi:hypothetical protein
MLTVPATPSDSNPTSFADDMFRLEQDIVAGQMRREADQIREMNRLQREDDRRCRGCQQPTEGLTICGVKVPVCPECFAAYVETSGIVSPAMAIV